MERMGMYNKLLQHANALAYFAKMRLKMYNIDPCYFMARVVKFLYWWLFLFNLNAIWKHFGCPYNENKQLDLNSYSLTQVRRANTF